MAMLAQKDMVGDDKMFAATGRTPDDWFALLDAAAATKWTHTQIAAWLRNEHSVPRWWNQAVTVRYEQARGMRDPGQKADGTYTAVGTRTVPLDPGAALERASVVLTGELGASPASTNPNAKAPNARWTLGGRERLLLTATPTTGDRTSVGLTHSGLTDTTGLTAAKSRIGQLLDAIGSAITEPKG